MAASIPFPTNITFDNDFVRIHTVQRDDQFESTLQKAYPIPVRLLLTSIEHIH
jgi:hypothetical protein